MLSQNIFEDFTCDIRQPKIAAVEAVGEFLVVDAHLMQNRGVNVVCTHAIFDGFVAELIGRSVLGSTFESAAVPRSRGAEVAGQGRLPGVRPPGLRTARHRYRGQSL